MVSMSIVARFDRLIVSLTIGSLSDCYQTTHKYLVPATSWAVSTWEGGVEDSTSTRDKVNS